MGTWTAGTDRSDGYVVGATLWNQMVGASGSMMFLYENMVRYKYKTASQDFTDATFVTVTATTGNIQFSVVANTAYIIEIDAHWSSTGSAASDGISLAFTLPSSPTYAHVYWDMPYCFTDATWPAAAVLASKSHADITSATEFFGVNAFSSGASAGVVPGNGKIRLHYINGANAGDVVFQAAQNTNGAGTTTIAELTAVCRQLGSA